MTAKPKRSADNPTSLLGRKLLTMTLLRMAEKEEDYEQASCLQHRMKELEELSALWFPWAPGMTDAMRSALMVPWSHNHSKMTPQTLRWLLEDKIAHEINANPEQAKWAMGLGPELEQITKMYSVEHWSAQIIMSDSMMRVLGAVNWDAEAKATPIPKPESLSFSEFLEQIF